MNKLLFAAPASGSGKTTVTCAVLTALKRRGSKVHAFKCGPDYIDPMFHRAALGIPCHNLDLYLTEEERLKTLFDRYSAGADIVVAEGVMGFYDGVGGVTPEASAWHVADVLDLPVVLVVRPKGASLSLGALVNGLQTVPESAGPGKTDSHIRALVLSDCSEMLCRSLKPMLEQETGLPVLGFLPHLEDAQFESRHLGLVTAGEDPDLLRKLDLLADAAEENIDLDALLALSDAPAGATDRLPAFDIGFPAPDVRIAVASDEAFQFCYDETLDAFREAGMEPVFFSPLSDDRLPEEIGALYLPGGYPELHAEALSANESMRDAIREAVQNGLPTVAECGGFLYLGQSLTTPEGNAWPMAGVLPGTAEKTGRPVRFGYAELTCKEPTLVAAAGTPVRIHNFHYYESSERGGTFLARKPVSGRSYETGFGTETLYAGFPHLYFAGAPDVCERIAEAARAFRKR
ncbi:MAG: cobyrinate a,c-diamide synthase [Clostridia bacterium]|nr:cobyrinate a,c-diamide synthase [Clostridia bacterium]MBQ3327882.1 cobyrinate a,c-diamide synthase [Clostridia bacterium]